MESRNFWNLLSVLVFADFVFVVKAVGKDVSIESLHIRSDITHRFATTLITSELRNNGDSAQEVTFDVRLPKAAFISNFSMIIDDVVYSGNVKEKEEARKQYQRAKKRGQSAGLVGQVPRDTSRFKVSVNVATNNTVMFNLTYQELLQRRLGIYEHVIYVNPGQIVPDLGVEVFIVESREISVLKVPSLRKDLLTDTDLTADNPYAVINRLSPESAHIAYYPTEEQQREGSTSGISGQFRVSYDVERSLDAGEILVVNGYFVHFIAPKGLEPLSKSIIFVLDSSGSMSGIKMSQLKAAMYTILDDLREGDEFNIVDFSSGIKFWRGDDMLAVSTESIREAKHFVRDMVASGLTNISKAIADALEFLSRHAVGKALMIMFLTDGQPSAGVTNKNGIINLVNNKNKRIGVSIMSLSFGSAADYSLLQKISAQNDGIARKIYEDADATLQLKGFYDEISTPVLSDVNVRYLQGSVDNNTLTTTDFNKFFEGSEIIVAGKINETFGQTLELSLEASMADGDLVLDKSFDATSDLPKVASPEDIAGFTERLWAYLTIKQLLDKRLNSDVAEQATIKETVTRLSLKYGFVTPYTSMVVTKPEKEKTTEGDGDDADHSGRSSPSRPAPTAPRPPSSAPRTGRPSGFADGDPHFVVQIPGLDIPVCFDVMGQNGDVFNLLSDPILGLRVFATMMNIHGQSRTFFGAITVKTHEYSIKIKPETLQVGHTDIPWRENLMVRSAGEIIGYFGMQNVSLHMSKNVTFVIVKHSRETIQAGTLEYLGFYIHDGSGLSFQTTGLLGEFCHKVVTDYSYKSLGDDRFLAEFAVSNRLTAAVDIVKASLNYRPDLEDDLLLPCWSVTKGLLDNDRDSYLVRHRSR